MAPRDVVTGAFGYTGKYITQRLIAAGRGVLTLTSKPDRPNPFGEAVTAAPFNFDKPQELARSLNGIDTIYNTYWVRFNYGGTTYDQAVENTKILFSAAAEAGVRRIVHVSITNPSVDSTLPYFNGKARLEAALKDSGVSHAILRPTVIFGKEDILINNIAWLLRRFPIFAIPGTGSYRLQPIYVEDMAQLAVEAGRATENQLIDAIGPETFTFDELCRAIAAVVGSRSWIVHAPPGLALFVSRFISWFVKDVLLTRDEVDGLLADLLVTDSPPAGSTRLSDWISEHADTLGKRYASELKRHFR